MRFRTFPAIVAGLAALLSGSFAHAAEHCTTAASPIETDRPDFANSALTVPAGSLQSENGVDVATEHGDRSLEGTNSRLRLGIAPCLEIVVDVPTYYAPLAGTPPSGFSDVTPGIKWQISPDPGNFDLSVALGAGLPTGSTAIVSPGLQPYLQFPWAKNLPDGWGMGGMVTLFERPADPVSKISTEISFEVGKDITKNFGIFAEYLSDYYDYGRPRQLFNSGALWRFTNTQQLDMHIAFGLSSNAPTMIVGLGYSFRLDGLFK
jgi:hypothetical protein